MFEMFKMGVLNSGPVKVIVYVWGLDFISKLTMSWYTILGLVCIMSGGWLNFMLVLSVAVITIIAQYYSSKYYELLKLLQPRTKTYKKEHVFEVDGFLFTRETYHTEDVSTPSDDENLLGDYLRSVTKKSEDGNYYITADEDLINNTNKDK